MKVKKMTDRMRFKHFFSAYICWQEDRIILMKALFFVVVLFASHQGAASETLIVDRSIATNTSLSFPNEENIQPDASDFSVLSVIPMSNERGERWVVVTIRNTASGVRMFNQRHLIGLFANGRRSSPLAFKQRFAPEETLSVTITFGRNKFPILSVYSRAE